MLLLFETAAGFALFKVLDEGKLSKVEDLQESFSSADTARKVVKLKAFSKFENTSEALKSANLLIDGKASKDLRKFLSVHCQNETLGVADTKLASIIKEKLQIDCVHNIGVMELLRGVRYQLTELIAGLAVQDMAPMSLGLSHSLSRYKLKFSADKVDTMIVQAIGLLDDLDKELNTYAMRVREWYGWHFPELTKIILDNIQYAKSVKLMGDRINAAKLDFSEILSEEVEAEVKEASVISMGTEIGDLDLENIRELCDQVLSLSEYRAQLYDYLKSRMNTIAPNLTAMVGELVGARLIAHGGSLINLAKQPGSTVQILGAEKALFRALKTKHATPKYGLIYHASLIGQAAPKFKGKISRSLAAKTALAIRCDALGDGQDNTMGLENRAKVVSDEARAMYNGGAAGLTYWSPNVNIFRDPRWGRGQETPGEDPVLAGIYAARYVKGLQGTDGNKLKVAACCKHFTAYDIDNWNGVDRFHFNAQVSKQDIEDTFDVPFRMCVKEGNVASVMCSYNQVNGVPTCADPNLLKKTVRGQWGLDGYIVSDCDSVGVFFNSQHYTSTPEEAAADAIKAGLDLDCGPFLGIHTQDAVKKGLLTEAHVNGALVNTLTVQMRLGMFDGEPSAHAYGNLGPKDVCKPAHQELALEAARQGIVLLKNTGPSLPLSSQKHKTVAVIGPNSNVTVTMIGNYAGIACGYTSPLQGIGRYAKTIHQQGCANVACRDDKSFGPALDAARKADATVLVIGLDQSIEAETVDRVGLLLPGHQQDLVSKVAAASKGPTILVLMSGGPVDITFAKNDPRIAAILWAGYPGQAGGAAIADILFGTADPGGKLPVTWYPQEYLKNLAMTNMAMRPSTVGYPGRTYRFYKGPVVYPFGHGLTYTHFVHTLASAPTIVSVPIHGHRHGNNTNISNKAIRVTHARCGKLSITLHVDVKNVGSRDGTHTLLVFSAPPNGGAHWVPQKQLVTFEKVHVPAKSKQRVRVNIHVCKLLSVVDRSGIRRIPMGVHSLHIGDVKHSVSLQAEALGIIKS